LAARRNLDRATVTQTAADLADAQGVEAVTLAAVAERLGVRIPSLYNHVMSLADLRQAMAISASEQLADQVRRAAVGRASDDAVIAIMNAYRAFAHAHPGLYRSVLRAPDAGETALVAASRETLDVLLRVLETLGVTGEDALHAVRGIRSALHGFVDLEAAGGFGMPLDRDESFRRLIGVILDGLHKHST
jgi:AcrR family transcriptional regulator